jgi:hypothetical protein
MGHDEYDLVLRVKECLECSVAPGLIAEHDNAHLPDFPSTTCIAR